MEKHSVSLIVNGDPLTVEIAPNESLFETLHHKLELVGAKRACDTGGCGCCTVLVNGKSRYSCMTYTQSVVNEEITTVEGLSTPDKLDPLQQSFMDTGAVQCGYCTSGMIMAAKGFLAENPNPSEEEIRKGIAGNLCRCTGYTKIVQAISQAAAAASNEKVISQE